MSHSASSPPGRRDLIRESTKRPNRCVAEQKAAAHKAAPAKGEVGIRENEPAPVLAAFAEGAFLAFVRSTSAAKPNTVRFYENSVANLCAHSSLSRLPLDQITSEAIGGFIAHRQSGGVQASTINCDLATLRRMFHLATEWGKVATVLPRVRLLPGEHQQERVLNFDEEAAYLQATKKIGDAIECAYQRALSGIRARRGQEPRRPDSYLCVT